MFGRMATPHPLTAGIALLAAASVHSGLAAAQAQQADAGESLAGDEARPLEEIVVTGTSRLRTNLRTPFSATRLTNREMRRFTANSQADILRHIPSIKAEGGGGEVANNVFIRGLPTAGQFQFTPLEYDGVTVFSSFGMDTSGPSFDQFYRNDLGLESLEYVTGGVTNLFGPGSVVGIINYTSKTGTDEPEAIMQTEYADRDRFRLDFAASGPLSENTYYAVSGFYRFDEGPIETGLETQGYQIRANIKREFEDGSGSFRVYGQFLDDETQFFLPLPLDGDTRKLAVGNDGNKVRTVQTGDAQGLNFLTPDGRFTTQIDDAIQVRGGSIVVAFDKALSDGWGMNAKAKYARFKREFNLFLDGDGVINTPETLDGFLAARGLPGLGNAAFTFSESSDPVPQNFLLFPNRLLDRDLGPTTDFTGELNLTKEARTGTVDHTFTLGGYFARAAIEEEFVISTFLAEFNNRPRLVDLAVTDEAGNATIISQNGLLGAASAFLHNDHEVTRFAGYFADQTEMGRLSVDVGVRVERFIGDIVREGSQAFVAPEGELATNPFLPFEVSPGASASLSPALRTVVHGNGAFDRDRVKDTAWAAALGISYELSDELSWFGNFSRGFFFPQLQGQQLQDGEVIGSFDAEVIKQSEKGVKFPGPGFPEGFRAFGPS